MSRRPPTRPEKLGRASTRWSVRKLAAYPAGDAPRRVKIGRERLRQILHKRGIFFQHTRTWKESTDPDRDAKLDRIEDVTSHFPDRCFAFDQFGPLSIRPRHGSAWARKNKPMRLPATYRRTHGSRYFHGCYSLGDDQLWGVIRQRKGADHALAALKSIRAARPGGYRLYVILDNLSANKTRRSEAGAQHNHVELCFTPANASWANPIEAQFGPSRTFTMGGSDHPNHTVLAARLQACLRWRNANARHHPQPAPATLGPPQDQSCITRPTFVVTARPGLARAAQQGACHERADAVGQCYTAPRR